MDTRVFSGARKVTRVSTLAEVNEIIENAKNVVNMVDVIIQSCHGSRVLNNMVDAINENFSALLHELYFDNFFTTYSLTLFSSTAGLLNPALAKTFVITSSF